MQLCRSVVQGVPVIGLQNPVDIDLGNAEEFTARFVDHIDSNDRRVVFDAGNAEFFDSAGMSALLSLRIRLEEQHGVLVLAQLNRAVSEIFRMVGFDIVFLTYPDVERAVRERG